MHLDDRFLRIWNIHKTKRTQGNVESVGVEQDLLGIHARECDVGDGSGTSFVARRHDHLLRQIDADDRAI
ncbi:MAG: hypothetical protein WAO08_16315 [Hyphomicrobiaceae bacterium]